MNLLWVLAVMTAAAGQTPAEDADASAVPLRTIPLHRSMAEVSGLVAAGPETVFAHNDEYAIVHEINIRTGAVRRSFAFGEPTVRDDFEAIAVRGDFVYLMTSDGRIFEGRITGHAERTNYNVYDTGLGGVCEFEGLATAPEENAFFLLCKRSMLAPDNDRIVIYRWTFEQRLTALDPVLNVSLRGLAPTPARGAFKAADLKIRAGSGEFVIVDANAGAVLELTRDGALAAYHELAPRAHPQAEGLAILPDGAVVIGDEGAGANGKLTVYAPFD